MIYYHFFRPRWLGLSVLIIGICLFIHSVQAQSLSQSVIGNSGDYYENPGVGSLHWTVGEIAVESYSNTQVLNQGFHQTYFDLLITNTWESATNFEIKAYPNPTTHQLVLSSSTGEQLQAQLYNLLGQPVLNKLQFQEQTELNVSQLPAGTYILQLFYNEQLVKTFKIQKVQP
jgi:hypothetical protein